MGASFSTSLDFTLLARDMFGAYSASEKKFTPSYSVALNRLAQMTAVFAASDSVSLSVREDERKRIKLPVIVADGLSLSVPDAAKVDAAVTFYDRLTMDQNIRDKIDKAFRDVARAYKRRREKEKEKEDTVEQGRVPAYFEYKYVIKAVTCEIWKAFVREHGIEESDKDDDDGPSINHAAKRVLVACKSSLDNHERRIRERDNSAITKKTRA